MVNLPFFLLGKRLALVKEAAAETSAGGIMIPENAREKPLTARIVCAGPEVNTSLQVGCEVIYASFAGTEIEANGLEIIIVDEEDILLCMYPEASREPETNDN